MTFHPLDQPGETSDHASGCAVHGSHSPEVAAAFAASQSRGHGRLAFDSSRRIDRRLYSLALSIATDWPDAAGTAISSSVSITPVGCDIDGSQHFLLRHQRTTIVCQPSLSSTSSSGSGNRQPAGQRLFGLHHLPDDAKPSGMWLERLPASSLIPVWSPGWRVLPSSKETQPNPFQHFNGHRRASGRI
jgi:hypothetical protein